MGISAVFLDRDGTVIHKIEVLKDPRKARLYKTAPAAVKLLNVLGYKCIIVSNQPNIEKGLVSKKETDAVNRKIIAQLKERGAKIHAVYICPHKYPSICKCRKPAIGLILQAKRDFNLDLKKSFAIGDSIRDVATGKNAKVKTILVKTGDKGGGEDSKFFKVRPDYVAKDLFGAAKLIQRLISRKK